MRMFSVSPFRTAKRAVIGLENRPPVVVFQNEETRVGGMPSAAPLVRVGSIAESDLIPAPAVHLEDAARGNRRRQM